MTVGWATQHIAALKRGETVRFRPHGGSMAGKVESGQLCTVEPLGENQARVGEIVLCSVRGAQYLHLVKAVRAGQVQIGNNRGGINGWTSVAQVYGRCVRVEP